VQITAGTFTGDGDLLTALTAGTSIAAAYNSSTETLTLTGADTIARYQAVLDSIAFYSTSSNPTDSGAFPTRTVSWTVTDGYDNSSLLATTIITVTPPPLLFVGADNVSESAASEVALQSGNGLALWEQSGGALVQTAVPNGAMGPEWSAVAVADFTGNGADDILWTSDGGSDQGEAAI
jgi:hypothetical protein